MKIASTRENNIVTHTYTTACLGTKPRTQKVSGDKVAMVVVNFRHISRGEIFFFPRMSEELPRHVTADVLLHAAVSELLPVSVV